MVGSNQEKPGPGPEPPVLLRLRLQPKMAPAKQICCSTYGVVSLDPSSIVSNVILGKFRRGYGVLGAVMLG